MEASGPGPLPVSDLTPWYEYSAIGQSNTDTLRFRGEPIAVGYEPSSVTRQYGLIVGARLALP
jgi:hypothetical protein